jgi:hypothetical protein
MLVDLMLRLFVLLSCGLSDVFHVSHLLALCYGHHIHSSVDGPTYFAFLFILYNDGHWHVIMSSWSSCVHLLGSNREIYLVATQLLPRLSGLQRVHARKSHV